MTDHVSDASLLERFVRGREEAAFVALVQRHGPRVLKVCRRFLRDEHEVEDVFQATFLVLALKAAGISWSDSIGSWLAAVAQRLALNARGVASRRQNREKSMSVVSGGNVSESAGRLPEQLHPVSDPPDEIERRDLRGLLDEALDQLPEKYRAPVVLCYFEGLTNEEAARQLGWPAGSISRRLDRARSMLRHRLTHCGLLLMIGLAGVILAQSRSGNPVIPPSTASPAVHEAMLPFRPVSQGGLDVEVILSRITRPEAPPADPDEVRLLSYQSVLAANRIEGHDPGLNRSDWRRYSRRMRLAALELSQAAEAGDRLAMLGAARHLDATCVQCHNAFRHRGE